MSLHSITRWVQVGDVLITCGTRGKPSDEEWDGLNRTLQTTSARKALALSLGTAELNSVQRAKTVEVLKKSQLKLVLVTDEKLMRGMVTAASWLGADVKAFSWKELDEAIKHLNVAPIIHERVLESAMKLRQTVTLEFRSLNKL